jgi:hypothetical protein
LDIAFPLSAKIIFFMKKKSCKSKGKSPKTESCSYCIEILDWEFPYSISINGARHLFDGLFLEGKRLELKGRVLFPKKLADKTIDITISGNRKLAHAIEHPEEYEKEPDAVGDLKIRGKERSFYGFVPLDVLNTIVLALQAEKIRYLVLLGQPLRYGKADIRAIDFNKDYIPEDWE